jgi:hypothetical protein
MKKMFTVIGRGHSGTRAISHTLAASGVYMGQPQNESGDLLPPDDMYEACRVMAKYVEWRDGLEWNFDKLHTMPIDPAFTKLIESYLSDVLASDGDLRGWKIPETTLVYPWIVRMFPEIHYIFWVRNPRDCILSGHKTDDLRDFGVEYPATDDVRLQRAISWKYQYDIVKATPPPQRGLQVRLEDYVIEQDATLERLAAFTGLTMAKLPVKPEAVARYRTDEGVNYYDFWAPAMREYGYDIPANQPVAKESA